MRLTYAMADQHLSFPIAPIFSVRASSVALEQMQIPSWRDPLAACLYFDLHHQGPKAFQEGYRAVKRVLAECPGRPLGKTCLYEKIRNPGGRSRSKTESVMHQHRNRPAGDFIIEIANRARFQNKIPLTYSELRRDLSGTRQSVL